MTSSAGLGEGGGGDEKDLKYLAAGDRVVSSISRLSIASEIGTKSSGSASRDAEAKTLLGWGGEKAESQRAAGDMAAEGTGSAVEKGTGIGFERGFESGFVWPLVLVDGGM